MRNPKLSRAAPRFGAKWRATMSSMSSGTSVNDQFWRFPHSGRPPRTGQIFSLSLSLSRPRQKAVSRFCCPLLPRPLALSCYRFTSNTESRAVRFCRTPRSDMLHSLTRTRLLFPCEGLYYHEYSTMHGTRSARFQDLNHVAARLICTFKLSLPHGTRMRSCIRRFLHKPGIFRRNSVRHFNQGVTATGLRVTGLPAGSAGSGSVRISDFFFALYPRASLSEVGKRRS